MRPQPENSADVSIAMGFDRLRSGDLNGAMQIADQLLETNPNRHGALNLIGLIARQQGYLERAIGALQRAIALHHTEPIYHCNLGSVYYQNHNYPEAIAACQQALQLHPDYTNALITLGSVYFATEQYQAALNVYQRAIELNPNRAIYHTYRADVLRALGQLSTAIAAYKKALTLSPNLTHAMGNLGIALLEIGQPEHALNHCRKAVEYDPHSSDRWINLGTVYRSLGMLSDAMDAYGKAYEIDPASAILCTAIGQVWQEVNDPQQAILWFDKALAIEPDRLDTRCALAESALDRGDIQTAIALFQNIQTQHPDRYQTYIGLSKAFWEDGNAEAALAIAYKAVSLQPEDAGIKVHLARILASAGHVAAANQTNCEALSTNPNCIPALVNLAKNLRGQLPEADVKKMEQLLNANWVRSGAKASLHFGLAHYYDGCKKYAQAAAHCTQANQLEASCKPGWQYDPNEYTGYVDRLITHFTPEFFQRTQGMGNASKVPIFVVGMPRSGTTLTEQILASHPKVFAAGERNFGHQGFYRLPAIAGCTKGTSVWQILDRITQPQVNQLADWHLSHLEELVIKASLDRKQYQNITDKMPDNYNLLGWLVTLFPNAKIVHCRRDVRDIAVSCWMNQFKSIRWALDLTHIAERVKQYWRIMEHWRQTLPVPMLEIDYEEIVANPVERTARLLDFVELEWDDACLQFYKTNRLVRTASVTQVRQPIYNHSIKRWHHYQEALQPFLAWLEI